MQMYEKSCASSNHIKSLAAHFERSNAILKDHTEIMTRFWDDPDFDPEKFSLK